MLDAQRASVLLASSNSITAYARMSSEPEDEVTLAIRVLERLAAEPHEYAKVSVEERKRLTAAAGRLSRPTATERRGRAKAFRQHVREAKRTHDKAVLSNSALRRQKELASFLPRAIHEAVGLSPAALPTGEAAVDPEERLEKSRACYVCKARYDRVHRFYHQMCPTCAALNFEKRSQTAPLDGRVAIITGARIKIGYCITLKLLRAGARVLATTRFPVDAARRYSEEPDYDVWRDRLEVHGLDLRHIPSVELFAEHLCRTLDRLDILVNNAAQTVRRPPEFYKHLLEAERAPIQARPEHIQPLLRARQELLGTEGDALVALRADKGGGAMTGVVAPSELAAMPWSGERAAEAHLFPKGQFDGDAQQVDLRDQNSWRLPLSEVPTPELIEVHLVNTIAPCLLTSRLKALMMRDRTNEKHIIQVSAMEASFSRGKKTDKHPHTNMAKAALNMMTRTSAVDYARDGIYMNSVDTGWVTDEDPLHHSVRKERDNDFYPPLDSEDGAARVLDPLFVGLRTGEHAYGLFLKDYRPIAW